MAIQKSIGKWKFRPPVELQPLKNFILKFGTHGYMPHITPHAKFGADWFRGVSP